MQELSIREKREFYFGLARLIRSGSAVSNALDILSRDAPGRVRRNLQALLGHVKTGSPLGEAMLRQRGSVSRLETAIISASDRSGRLDRGCDQLARYFDAIERARAELRKRMLYPLVVLHFGVFVFNIQKLMASGVNAFLGGALWTLLMLYAAAGIAWILWEALAGMARTSPVAEGVIIATPGVGPVRWNFALARFLTTLDAQLEAGVNIWDAFAQAARTSDSARILAGARKAMPILQSGASLSDALSKYRILPQAHIRHLRVAEQSGELAQELARLAEQSEQEAVASLQRWSEWLPRVVYAGVLLYTGYQIVSFYQGYLKMLGNFGNLEQ